MSTTPTPTRPLRRGDRCEVTGVGRTGAWLRVPPGAPLGTVVRRRGSSVFVRWDGTSFEDEMTADEVQAVTS